MKPDIKTVSGVNNTELHRMFYGDTFIHFGFFVLLFNAFGEHGKYKPRFCVHIAKFVMCRQPHQKSGCKQPRTSSYTTPSTECFAGEDLSKGSHFEQHNKQPLDAIKLFYFLVVTYNGH